MPPVLIMIPEFDISRGVKLFQNLRCSGNKHVFNVVGSWMSEKYDGVRAIYFGSGKLITCRGLRIEAPKSFFVGFPDGYVLDGELWISHNNFNTISGLVRKSSQTSPIWDSVKFLVFDIIHSYDSRFDVTQMTFEQRQELLSSLIPSYETATTPPQSNGVMGECTYPHPPVYGATPSVALPVYGEGGFGGGGALPGAPVRGGYEGGGAPPPPPATVGCGESFSDSESTSDGDVLESSFKRCCCHIYRIQQYPITSLEAFREFYDTRVKHNAEGVVVIPRGEKYRPGVRSNYKLKEVDEVEGVVVDYKEGNGKNAGLVGSFTVKMLTSEGNVLSKMFSIGTGLTQYQRQHGRELYPVGTVLTCHYNGLTSSGVPRFPRLKGVRVDIIVKDDISSKTLTAKELCLSDEISG